MTKTRSIVSKALPIFGVLLFAYILYRVGLGNIWGNIRVLNLKYFSIAVALLIPTILIKAFKWNRVLAAMGFKYPLGESSKSLTISYFIGSLTPARLGDFTRALYLKKYKVSLSKAFSSVLIDRLFDVGILVLMAVFSVITLVQRFSLAFSSILLVLFIAVSFGAILLLVLRKKLMRKLLKPFFYMLIPEKFQKQLINIFDDFYTSIAEFSQNLSVMFSLSFLTLISWIISFISTYFIALSLGIEIKFFILLLMLPFSTLVEMLPISFSGVGTRDAVFILMFSLLAIPAAKAVSFSLMILIFNYILCLVGALLWVKKPFKV
jgi:hypothetical protein|tara:strand:+ start:653 stop:1615 length:963 start_codon:yes stop_codon:yes gene_type:complete